MGNDETTAKVEEPKAPTNQEQNSQPSFPSLSNVVDESQKLLPPEYSSSINKLNSLPKVKFIGAIPSNIDKEFLKDFIEFTPIGLDHEKY
jgi:hypothetical protein